LKIDLENIKTASGEELQLNKPDKEVDYKTHNAILEQIDINQMVRSISSNYL
jgi:hypothetical protein